jgi:hypothetical protein
MQTLQHIFISIVHQDLRPSFRCRLASGCSVEIRVAAQAFIDVDSKVFISVLLTTLLSYTT